MGKCHYLSCFPGDCFSVAAVNKKKKMSWHIIVNAQRATANQRQRGGFGLKASRPASHDSLAQPPKQVAFKAVTCPESWARNKLTIFIITNMKLHCRRQMVCCLHWFNIHCKGTQTNLFSSSVNLLALSMLSQPIIVTLFRLCVFRPPSKVEKRVGPNFSWSSFVPQTKTVKNRDMSCSGTVQAG